MMLTLLVACQACIAAATQGSTRFVEIGPSAMLAEEKGHATASDTKIAKTPWTPKFPFGTEAATDAPPPAMLAEEKEKDASVSMDGSMPYFLGSWSGTRNNWYGDVGISFVAQKTFKIVSLGRHHHDKTGLKHTAPVTLWSVETQRKLAVLDIGPHSVKEGHYHWEPIDSPGVTVTQGREYRLTQACTPGMEDKWYDEAITFEEVEAMAATGYARFVGGVNESGFGYPESENGQFRRPGIVNFKFMPPADPLVRSCSNRPKSLGAYVASALLACLTWRTL